VATRLNLGACSESRYLRATLIELLSALLGDEVRHPDMEQAGALEPPPEMLPAAHAAPGPQAPKPAQAPYQPGAVPREAITMEEALKRADARGRLGQSTPVGATAQTLNTPAVGAAPLGRVVPIKVPASAAAVAAAAAPTQTRPDPTVPDPGGESFLENLAGELDADVDQGGEGGGVAG
jgi:hypothetical protein